MLTFFATWCRPCFDKELPALALLQEQYAVSGLRVVGLNVRFPEQPVAQALAETQRRLSSAAPLPFPLLFDRTLRNQRVYLGESTTLPASLVFEASGTLVHRSRGAAPEELDRLRRFVEQRLGAPRVASGAVPPAGEPEAGVEAGLEAGPPPATP